MDLRTSITMVISVVLGIAGFFVTYFNNVRLERKKNRLERINDQLNYFYGPLLAIVQSNQQAWENFIARYGNNPNFYKKNQNPTPEQVAEFHQWMSTVFMPNNEKLYEIIINKTSLLDEDKLPTVLLDLLAHILEFRMALRVRNDEFAEVTERKAKYPGKKLLEYCENQFVALKTEQNKLIKSRRERKKQRM